MSSSAGQRERRGILAGGNFITDFVKIISDWPEQDALATILEESMGNGGGAYNLLKDLAALDLGLPLEAVGRVGGDANGRWILEDCQAVGIATDQLRTTKDEPTSYTDAMTVTVTGRRTFFHQRGANARLAPEDFDFGKTRARVFYLGYLMLLDRLDAFETSGRTAAREVLESASAAGLRTAVDLVSARDARFREVVLSALPCVDLFFLNEIEAGYILERPVAAGRRAMLEAAGELADLGVRETVVIHGAEGAVAASCEGGQACQGRVRLPGERIVGSTGAGDAFAAGFLSGWHDGMAVGECLQRAVNVAAASLTAASASDGVTTLADCLQLGANYGYLDF